MASKKGAKTQKPKGTLPILLSLSVVVVVMTEVSCSFHFAGLHSFRRRPASFNSARLGSLDAAPRCNVGSKAVSVTLAALTESLAAFHAPVHCIAY